MPHASTEQQLRSFLLMMAGAIFVGTPVELTLIEHTGDTIQWIPFIMSGLGVISLAAVWVVPSPKSLLALRGLMVITSLGSLFGIYEHFMTNLAFSREIHPAYSVMENIGAALKGASPMMAPGIFLLAALLAWAATYKHPLLESSE